MIVSNRAWQSKLIVLVVVPYTAFIVIFEARHQTPVLIWSAGLSAVLGLLAWRLRTATPAGALTGALISASLMVLMMSRPFKPWNTGLLPLLAVLILTSAATRMGSHRKEGLGTAEERHGRGAAQVAANLGMAALAMNPFLQTHLTNVWCFSRGSIASPPLFALGLAALAEAAADTVSSEVGQVLGDSPRMITTLRRVAPGTDGGITVVGSAAGILAAGVVAGTGCLALHVGVSMLAVSWAGGVFGLFFDSLLGATLERAGGLNNDAVNFLSTGGAVIFALAVLAIVVHTGAQ